MARFVVLVEMVIEGDINDAVQVIDGLLDNGVFQGSINGHDADCGPLEVLTARIVPASMAQKRSALRFANNTLEKLASWD